MTTPENAFEAKWAAIYAGLTVTITKFFNLAGSRAKLKNHHDFQLPFLLLVYPFGVSCPVRMFGLPAMITSENAFEAK
jgi:hypothetical protein